jgi:hypothetical protein
VECVIADDEAVISEGTQYPGLFARLDIERFLYGLDTRHQMGIAACAADACQHLWDSRYRLADHSRGEEAFVFLDSEMNRFHLTIFERHIETGRSFDLGDLIDTELTHL